MAKIIEQHLGALGLQSPMSSDDLATVLFALGDGFIMTKLIEPDEIHDDLFGQALVLMLAGLQSSEPAPA